MNFRWWLRVGDKVKIEDIADLPTFGPILWSAHGTVKRIVPRPGYVLDRDVVVELDANQEHPVTHETLIRINTICVERV